MYVKRDSVALRKVEWCEIPFGAHLHLCFETVVDRHFTSTFVVLQISIKCVHWSTPASHFPISFPFHFLFLLSFLFYSSTSSALHIFILSTSTLMYQLLRSLAYIHTNGVCHRDIKPQILLLNPWDWHLETLQFWQVGFYLPFLKQAVKLTNHPVPFQFCFDLTCSLTWMYM